jgi:dienelactone hydrolase
MLLRGILLALCLTGCASYDLRSSARPVTATASAVTLFDAARQRPVPILIYGKTTGGRKKPLAIISHGYGGHGGDYTFLAGDLVTRGYLVVAIEHIERSGDPPMVNSGNLAVLRRPVWQVGADSIGFVIREMARQGLSDPSYRPLLVGHSNGGDMTMLFATEHPEKVRIALSLDNRRMPMPRLRKPKICSLRSSDHVADPGVLPSPTEQAMFGMSIIAVPVKHDDMWDGATSDQKKAMLEAIGKCLDA